MSHFTCTNKKIRVHQQYHPPSCLHSIQQSGPGRTLIRALTALAANALERGRNTFSLFREPSLDVPITSLSSSMEMSERGGRWSCHPPSHVLCKRQ